MAYISDRHEYNPIVFLEEYDHIYSEPRQYISGSSFFGFGSISTRYQKDLISFKTREVWVCGRCGKEEKDKVHNMKISLINP